MIIEIRNVKNIKDGSYGTTTFQSKYRALIKVAESKNTTIDEWSNTVLHELLHVWIALLKANGAKIDRRFEHRYIYQSVDTCFKLLNCMRRK